MAGFSARLEPSCQDYARLIIILGGRKIAHSLGGISKITAGHIFLSVSSIRALRTRRFGIENCRSLDRPLKVRAHYRELRGKLRCSVCGTKDPRTILLADRPADATGEAKVVNC